MRPGDMWTGVLFGAGEDQLKEIWGDWISCCGVHCLCWLEKPFPIFKDSGTSQIVEIYQGQGHNELWTHYIWHQDKTPFIISPDQGFLYFLKSLLHFVWFCSALAAPGVEPKALAVLSALCHWAVSACDFVSSFWYCSPKVLMWGLLHVMRLSNTFTSWGSKVLSCPEKP